MNQRIDKLAFFLPNIFTAMNIGCGFIGIIFSMQGNVYKACMFIVLGAIFDSVDGRVARFTGTQSAFGEQFDSLSDLISFGMAPAIIFYNRFLFSFDRVGIVVAFIFLLCGALRLARFNANIERVSSEFFQGLPIPGSAVAILSFTLMSIEFNQLLNPFISIPYMIFYGLLMISNIPFTSFKSLPWLRKNKKKVLFIIFMILASLFIYEEVMIAVSITSYVIFSIVYFVLKREKFKGVFEWDEDE